MSTAPETAGGRGSSGRGRKGRGRSGGRGGPNKGSAKPSSSNAPNQGSGDVKKSKSRPPGRKGGRGGGVQAGRGRGGGKAPKEPELSPQQKQEQEEAKRKQQEAEAEQKRLQEEAKAKEQAEKERREEQTRVDGELVQAVETLQALCDLLQQRATFRAALQPEALAVARKEFTANKKKLKTDLKKCTTFVKKVKSGTAWSMRPDDLSKELASLNLSRYVEEVAAAVLETKPKVADLPLLLTLCKDMHSRYAEFMDNLTPGLWNVIKSQPGGDPDAAKLRRLYMRFVTELFLSGITTDGDQLVKVISQFAGAKDNAYVVQDAPMMVAFCKSASPDVFAVAPTSAQNAVSTIRKYKHQLENDSEKSSVAPSAALVEKAMKAVDMWQDAIAQVSSPNETFEKLAQHSRGVHKSLSATLVQTHRKLQVLEKRCAQDRLLSGSLTEAREKGLADARKLRENLLRGVESLSDALDVPTPQLEEDEEDEGAAGGLGVEVWTKGEGEEDIGPFDDEETKAFYCDIPDLLTTVPPALLGLSENAIEKRKIENERKYGSYEGEEDAAEAVAEDVEMVTEEAAVVEENEDGGEENDKDNEDEDKNTPHYKLTVLLEQELPECNRREQIDEITEKFVTNHGSSKNSRKRLVKTLFLLPHSRLDLIPYYSRMAASIDRVFGEMGDTLVNDLEQQFHGQAKFKKNQSIDFRMKTARYVGELTKFRVAPPIVFLRCMRRCLDDFTTANVDVACCLLESCGRFLYRLPHTNKRMIGMMDTMTRLGKAKHLDERLQSLIKAAFFSVNPPPTGPKKQAKQYPPLEAYMRYLLLDKLKLSNQSVSFTAKQIARLPWSDATQQCGALTCRLMLKACRRGRYTTIQAIALVAANLRTQKFASETTIRLIDGVIEELRWALDLPNFRDQQRIITYARLLGELYCASQVPAEIVLRQLYDFINIGHEIPEALRQASRKLSSDQNASNAASTAAVNLPVYNSAGGTAHTIQEDEEFDEEELETKEEVKTEEVQAVAVSEHSKYDPRVPSAKDPPNASYRVKLVCTLLEVTANRITSRNNLPRLKGFITAFQRYLFTKTMLPTDVEFALLDTFDILDSKWKRLVKTSRNSTNSDGQTIGFPRYQTWNEAHVATLAIEESEALFEEQQDAKLAAGMTESRASANDDESASLMDEDEESFSGSEKDSVEGEPEEEAQSSDEGDEDDDEEEDDESGSDDASEYDDDYEEFDEEAHMKQLEQEAFERELRRLTMDALEKGKGMSRKLVADYMPSGSQVIKKKPPQSPAVFGPKPGEEPQAAASLKALGGKTGISFQILQKGSKGKVEAKSIVVPADTNLAEVATRQDDEAARERHEIKQRVLQYEADRAESDLVGGNVYLEQEKLQIIRNRPLSMEEIDKNFGTTRGNLVPSNDEKERPSNIPQQHRTGRGSTGRSYQGRGRGGRGRGRNTSGRTLF